MKDNYIFKLQNGPKLIFYQDTTKHSVSASIIVKYGGMYDTFEVNNKTYHMGDGIAHYLEHLLIEHSIYGNALTEFHNNYISFNGFTSSKTTRFILDTVHDFEENLVKLIKLVNVPNFTEKDIEDTKPAIVEEIRKYKDNKFRCLDRIVKQCIFKNIKYLDITGNEEYIKNLGYADIKLCYDTFYQPHNQIIAICGNFDTQKIKELIEKTYREINKPFIEYKVPPFLEPNNVVKLEDNLLYNTNQKYTQITYKINAKDFKGYEGVKLSFYLDYYLLYNFGTSSDIYKYMIENKITTTDINITTYSIDNFILVDIGTYTDKSNEFIELIKQQIKEKIFNEEDFEIRKKKNIISLILREENPSDMLEPFIDNIISYEYEDIDKIEDIEAHTYEDYKEMINKLDFTNYSVTHLIPNE